MKCTIAEYMQKRCEQGGKPLIIVCALQMSTKTQWTVRYLPFQALSERNIAVK